MYQEYVKISGESVAINIGVVFKSGQSLQSILTRVKDKLPSSMYSCIVYCTPFSCGKVYISETRIKENKDTCKKGPIEKSAVAEHAWTNQHPIL